MDSLVEICQELTQGYDKSHDLSHHLKVLENAEIILDQSDDQRMIRLVRTSAMLHDTIDDKYCTYEEKTQKEERLRLWLTENYPNETEEILWIMENVSFSKEKKRGHPAVHQDPTVTQALRIVSDADKIEALGVEGIKRMLDYNMNQMLGNSIARSTCYVPERKTTVKEMAARVKEHTGEKLCLLKDHYIHTLKGKELATPLHLEMMELVNNDQELNDLIVKDGRFV
jgi:uncharacterized protein